MVMTPRFLFALCAFHFALAIEASELTVSAARVTLDDSVVVTLTLEGSFAAEGPPLIPTQNLTLAGAPSVSSEFRWINGVSSRRKVFRWTARPRAAGKATVGPLLIRDESGKQLRLAALEIEVAPETAFGSGDPDEILRRLESLSKEAVFVLAELNTRPVTVGEQLVVTWFLYAADPIRNFQMAGSPSLADFWVEEIALGEQRPVETTVGGRVVQRLAVRRAALFPLRPGRLEIPSMEMIVEVLRPIEPFGMFGRGGMSPFEGSVVEVRRRSPARSIEVLPIPGERPPDAVGSLELRCSQPGVAPVGPVSIDVELVGKGNLRAAKVPAFTQPVAGRVEVQGGLVSVERRGEEIFMRRRWKLLLFPSRGGSFVIPTLAIDTWDPELRTRRTLQCAERALAVPEPATPSSRSSSTGAAGVQKGKRWTRLWIAILLAALVALKIIFRRSRAVTGGLEELLVLREDPRNLRRKLLEQAQQGGESASRLFEDPSEKGESFRALHSWIDLMEKEPAAAADSSELERRARRWIATRLSSDPSS